MTVEYQENQGEININAPKVEPQLSQKTLSNLLDSLIENKYVRTTLGSLVLYVSAACQANAGIIPTEQPTETPMPTPIVTPFETPSPKPTETPTPTPLVTEAPTPEPLPEAQQAVVDYLSGVSKVTPADRFYIEDGNTTYFTYNGIDDINGRHYYLSFLVGLEKYGENDIDGLFLYEKDGETFIVRQRLGIPDATLGYLESPSRSDIINGNSDQPWKEVTPNEIFADKDYFLNRAMSYFLITPIASGYYDPDLTQASKLAKEETKTFHEWLTGKSDVRPDFVMTRDTGYIPRPTEEGVHYPIVNSFNAAPIVPR